MVLGVLSNPGVAVVDVGGHDVLVHDLGHHHKPLGQEVSLGHTANHRGTVGQQHILNYASPAVCKV